MEKVSLYLPRTYARALRLLAKKHDKPYSSILRTALREYLQKHRDELT